MATLNTLRTKGGVIVIAVIGVALLAFLLGDLTGNGTMFNSKVNVGTVNGEDISYIDYYDEVEYLTDINKLISGSTSLTQQQQDAIRDIAWDGMVRKYTLYPGWEKLGISVTDAEMFDLIYGENISPVLVSAGFFNDRTTGAYDKSLVRSFISTLDADNTGNVRAIWEYIQKEVREEAMMSKYMNLVARMVYVTDVQVEQGLEHANNYYNAKYVGQMYSTVADSLVNVTNAEIKKYYEENKNHYKQVASRDIEYVVFEVAPSAEDYAAAVKEAQEIAADFEQAENIQQFVTMNSQSYFDQNYYSKDQLMGKLADFAFSGEKGVYGPELENEKFILSRVSDVKMVPDSVSLRQMMLVSPDSKLADSVVNALNGGAAFDKLAAEVAGPDMVADMSSMSTSIIPAQILQAMPEGTKRAFKMESANGIFIFDVYKKGKEVQKVQIGTVEIPVDPSAATLQAALNKASTFVSSVTGSYDKFNSVAAENAYYKRVVRVTSSETNVSGLEDSRELVRWAFNAKDKDVSGIMEIDGDYVIAALASSRESGYASVDQVTPEIKNELRREKKAEILADKMNNAPSLESLVSELNAQVQEAADVTFESYYVPGLASDLAPIGVIAGGVQEGVVSKPIKGSTGVYRAMITSRDPRGVTTPDAQRVRIEAQYSSYIGQRITLAVQDMSDITDMRVKYF